jgi:drug/metabolite transporter (DMT)-like permease
MTDPWRVGAALAATYFLWGANYLAIRIAVEEMPPLLMMGVRSVIAGAILFALGRLKSTERITAGHWRSAAIAGALLFLGCHGSLAWAEQHVPSGIAAVVLATIPIWMSVLDWLGGGPRPSLRASSGMAAGVAGVVLLMWGRDRAAEGEMFLLGPAVLLMGSLSWAAGSIVSRRMASPASLWLATGMQLLIGGGLLVMVGLALAETSRLDAGALAPLPLLALAYMIVMSSLVGFVAYAWLLRVSTPARAGSYAFVNPVVAVWLGWAIAGEPLAPSTLIACLVIVVGVALVVVGRSFESRSAGAAVAAGTLSRGSTERARST